MLSSPLLSSLKTNQKSNPTGQIEYLQDEIDEISLDSTTRPGGRSGKRSPGIKGKHIATVKGKRRRRPEPTADGECYLLNLPLDVLHILLCRLPPRTLKKLSVTCKTLREDLQEESIWRESYINWFLWDGAARDSAAKEVVKVLVQSCQDGGGRGWKREALARETMLERWTLSKQAMVLHTPPVGLIHSLSLSYPPYVPAGPKPLVVGKTHPTPNKTVNGDSSSTQIDPATPADTPTKMTHRQKYESLLAATTRPAPYVLSAGLDVGGVIRSDPMSSKVSKGYWGPGRDANFHLRPHVDAVATPSAIFLPPRTKGFVLWGLYNGCCVYTTMATKSQSSQGGRASSVNVRSEFKDRHDGEIRDIWMPEQESDVLRWVTGGRDGVVKLWQLQPGEPVRSGKKTSTLKSEAATISCLFTSTPATETLPGRSEAIKRRQSGKPDDIVFARFDPARGTICSITADGDLRIWFNAGDARMQEVRVDVGSGELEGEVDAMELDLWSGREEAASILIHHKLSPLFVRYDISVEDGETRIIPLTFASGHSAITTIACFLNPAQPISNARPAPPVLSTPLLTPVDGLMTPSSTASDVVSDVQAVPLVIDSDPDSYGRFVATGDENGYVSLWSWDQKCDAKDLRPIRSWYAMTGRITAIDVACGLVAVGSHDGYIKVFDPLPDDPTLLRTFHASHLSPADALVAAGDDPEARHHTVNQIILENDLIVASLGRRVFAWKAGTGKGRVKGEGTRKASSSRNGARGNIGTFDMKRIQRDAADSHDEIRSHSNSTRTPTKYEQQQFAAMDDLGLEDGDDALQYALMLSMEEQGGSSNGSEGRDEHAFAPIEAYEHDEDYELREMLEMIRIAEERQTNA